MSAHPTIGLLGPYGIGNLGDAAIQQSMIDHIKGRFPDAVLYGLSLNPKETERRHGIPSIPIMRMDKRRLELSMPKAGASTTPRLADLLDRYAIIRVLRRVIVRVPQECLFLWQSYRRIQGLGVLIISGGGQLDDYWGGAWHHPFTLLKWTAMARLTKTTVVFVSVGAGPLDAPLSRLFIRCALRMAAYRSYRDEGSKTFIRNIGFRGDGKVYPDLAHCIEVKAAPCTNNSRDGDRRLEVTVGPMIYFHPQEWPEKDVTIYRHYLSKLAQFIEWLCANDYTVKLIPGSITQDAVAICDLMEILRKKNPASIMESISAPAIDTVNELLAELNTTDIVVTSRFHGVLLSHIMNKPVVALSPHMKVDALLNDMGQPEYCLDINTFEAQDCIDRIIHIREHLDDVKLSIRTKEEAYRARLEEQFQIIFDFISPASQTASI